MMSSADLLEDGFPHGTPQGYDQGCHSAGGCPTGAEYGLSCKTAKMRSRNDYQYQQLARSGATVAEIADALGLIGHAPTAAPKKPARKSKTAPKVADELDQPATATADVDSDEPPAPAEAPAEDATDQTTTPKHTTRDVRAWARQKGYDVSDRGIIRQEIVDHYWEAHGLLDDTADTEQPTDQTPKTTIDLTDPHKIRAFVGPLRNDDGSLNTSRVAQEATLRERAGLPAWIAELDAPATTPEAEKTQADDRPDYGTMNLEHDLTETIAERDRARDLAARLGEELARSEEQREHERLIRAQELLKDHRTIEHLQNALAAASTALHTTERALELVLQKWDDATRQPNITVDMEERAAAVVAEVTGEPRIGRFERTMARAILTAALAAGDEQ
ncbi:histone-like nucleoid-structuring protein Lsr2 [Microbacterium sp. Mu-80]|uniref:Histone-like nucleoid-structuring protein Lsr2 n=1 Tax=Microbacterium bandirmense TaxID=3122050 RepID=A0ABU8L6T4_9MICO